MVGWQNLISLLIIYESSPPEPPETPFPRILTSPFPSFTPSPLPYRLHHCLGNNISNLFIAETVHQQASSPDFSSLSMNKNNVDGVAMIRIISFSCHGNFSKNWSGKKRGKCSTFLTVNNFKKNKKSIIIPDLHSTFRQYNVMWFIMVIGCRYSTLKSIFQLTDFGGENRWNKFL